jgi:polyhydroxyalkanoate synthesis regulator phasin
MFKKSITAILLVFLVILGVNAQASWYKYLIPFIEKVAIEVVDTFLRDNVKPEEVAVLKNKVSDLERQLYLLKQEGHNPPDFDSVEQTVLRLTKIVEAMESRFSLLEDRVTALEKRVTALEQDIPFVRQSIARWNEERLQNSTVVQTPKYNLRAEIDDPDGYTNVRSLPSIKGQILDVVREGEVFYTHYQNGNWWHIKTPRNKVGYMHSSRIKLLK